MTDSLRHVRHGFGSARPYVHGHLDLWELVRDAFGAVEVEPPEDKPYQERAAGVRDSFGNIWYISTYRG